MQKFFDTFKDRIGYLKKYERKHIAGAMALIIFPGSVMGYLLYQPTPKFIGMHDPQNFFENETRISMHADYLAWNKNLDALTHKLKKAEKLQRAFTVTIEPWPTPVGFKHESNDDLLNEISSGKYDSLTNEICATLSAAHVPVYIRWGHEMELGESRYPWSNATPETYIKAYKHFVDTCRIHSKSFTFVWSPAGETGLEKYWVGPDYADVIGLSVYSYDQYDEKHIGHKRSFNEVFMPIYKRVIAYKKPILIAEMGVTGSDEYKREWIGWMMKDLHRYKKLIGVVYLNTLDPQAVWGDGLGNPDWKLPANIVELLFPTEN